jgi:hypothetical protein
MTTPKRLAIILGWLMLSITALSQMTNNGNVVSVGQVNNSRGGGGGAPLTYGARTDTCVTGSETGCTGLGLSFQMRLTDTPPFASYPNAPMNTAATDPDFHSYLVMVTDWTTKNQATLWEVNNGNQALFNLNSTMVLVRNVGGSGHVMLLNPTAIHVHPSGTCTGCVANSSIVSGAFQSSCGTSCTNIDPGANVVWSLVPGETNVMYELATDNVTVNKLTIQAGCTIATPLACTFSRTPYVQFTSDSPVACSVLPSNYQASGWNGIINGSYDGSFMYALGGAADWLPSIAYTYPDSFIFPQANNGGSPNKAFQATVSGTSGGSEPNWALNCPNLGNTCTDGGVTWTNIGSIKGQRPAFDLVAYSPIRGCSRFNTRIGTIYRGTNQGASYPSAGTPDPSGTTTTDDDTVCGEYGTNPCPLPDTSTIHDGGGEADGLHATFTPDTVNDCIIKGTCSCTAATNANYLGAWNSGTAYVAANQDTVYDPSHSPHSLYFATINSTNQAPFNNPTYWTPADGACDSYIWDVNSTIVRPCMTRGSSMNGQCDGHVVHGYLNYFHGTSGISSLYSHLYSKPSVAGHANPGVGTLPTGGVPNGYHGTYLNMGTADAAPYGLSNDDVPTATYAIGPNGPGGAGNLPWYAEFTMQSVNLTPCSPPGNCLNGGGVMYRMAHMFNTGSNPIFNLQNNVSAVSPDGQFAMITTDMMGTRGSTSADWMASHGYVLGATMFPTSGNPGNFDYQIITAPTGNSGATEPAWSTCQSKGSTCTDSGVVWTNLGASCNQLRAFYAPQTLTTFSLGDTIFPLNSNSGTNLFKATQAGTTYSSLPNWNLAPNWGNTICDDVGHAVNQSCSAGIVQWTNIGPNDCRGDIMLVDLLSAH